MFLAVGNVKPNRDNLTVELSILLSLVKVVNLIFNRFGLPNTLFFGLLSSWPEGKDLLRNTTSIVFSFS